MNKNWLAWYDFCLFGKSFSERVSRQAVWLNNVMAESEVQVNLISDNFSLNFWVHLHCLDPFYTYDFIATVLLIRLLSTVFTSLFFYLKSLAVFIISPPDTGQCCVFEDPSQRKTYFSGINASYFSFSQVKLN